MVVVGKWGAAAEVRWKGNKLRGMRGAVRIRTTGMLRPTTPGVIRLRGALYVKANVRRGGTKNPVVCLNAALWRVMNMFCLQ